MTKKKTTIKKFVKRDIFPTPSIFDFTKDPIIKVRPKHHKPSNVKKWKERDFISYLREKLGSHNSIFVNVNNQEMLKRLQDKLTIGLQVHSSIKDVHCDNEILKSYLDWWLSKYSSSVMCKNPTITTTFLYRDKLISEFFKTNYWMLEKQADSLSGALKKIYPPSMAYQELYEAGGLRKLLYDAGIVDSYYFLKTELNKKQPQIINEMRKALNGLHEAVFLHVLSKTLKKSPYDSCKKFDVQNIVQSVIQRRAQKEYGHYDFNDIFETE